MPTNTYVFVDVETTGLNPQRDAIIEVAAIVWRDGKTLETFETLINPNRPIPTEITQITGIDDNMVADAPAMFSVRTQLKRIIADHVLVGHNVGFDQSFLQAERLALNNYRVDTVTLASILAPEIGRYSLENLITHFGFARFQDHRALNDARHTLSLFEVLLDRAARIPLPLLEEIIIAGDGIGWPETPFFRDAAQKGMQHAFDNGAISRSRVANLFNPPRLEGQTVVPREDSELEAIDVDAIASMLLPGANFSQYFPSYEYREQQLNMVAAIGHAFNQQQHLLVEAGTGTGKSIGYLLPAAFWAAVNGRRVVISTNTINLQDQLLHKDIPALQELIPIEFRAAVRKGRNNYLCTRLFKQMRHNGPGSADEMAVYARILLWLGVSETGDVSEISLRTPGERMAWRRLSADVAKCRTNECSLEKCPLHIARRRAEMAHIVIINHSLLLANVATGSQILPPFRDLIIDEAHHLEDAVTNGLSFQADKKFLEAILEDVTRPRAGLLGKLLGQLGSIPQEVQDVFAQAVQAARQEGQLATIRLEELFSTLHYFLSEFFGRNSEFAQQIRLIDGIRTQSGWDDVVIAWDNLNLPLQRIEKHFSKLARGLADLKNAGHDVTDADELQAALMANATGAEETRLNLDQIIARPNTDMIYWAEIWRDRVSLHAAPLNVGPLVEEHLFNQLDAVILTSATLRTAPLGRYDEANFDYIRTRLNAGHSDELAVGSPFDYESNTLLYLCSDVPEPNQPGYQRVVNQALVDIAAALGGRTLVLFTSYRQLRETGQAIAPALDELGITLLAQSEGSSRQRLLDQFKEPDARAVLLGTRSFWEGVDVPGVALTAVVLVKLPFDVPSDPIIAARSETFENAFYEYTIPEAVLKFRQGFGRLIRRIDDEGIVVVLDKRVLSRRYGELFIAALPECTTLRQRVGRLPEIIDRWQNRAR